MHGVLAAGAFAGAVAITTYIPDWRDTRDLFVPYSYENDLLTKSVVRIEATAVS